MDEQVVSQPQKQGSGPFIGILIVVVILIIGGIYFWKMNVQKKTAPAPYSGQSNETPAQADLNADVNNVGADLNATDFDTIDQGL